MIIIIEFDNKLHLQKKQNKTCGYSIFIQIFDYKELEIRWHEPLRIINCSEQKKSETKSYIFD